MLHNKRDTETELDPSDPGTVELLHIDYVQNVPHGEVATSGLEEFQQGTQTSNIFYTIIKLPDEYQQQRAVAGDQVNDVLIQVVGCLGEVEQNETAVIHCHKKN